MLKLDKILFKLEQYLEVPTDTELAKALGINRNTFGSYRYRGRHRGTIPYEVLFRACEKHGLAISRLLDDESNGLDDDILNVALRLQKLKETNKTQFGHIEATLKMFLNNFV